MQKLCSKYGRKHELVIGTLVDQFLVEKDQIQPNDLAKLEKEVVVALKAKLPASAIGVYGDNANETVSKRVTTSKNEKLNLKQSENENLSGNAKDEQCNDIDTNGSEWQVIQAYQIVQAEEKAREEIEQEKAKKVAFRRALDKHVEDAKKLKQLTEDKADAEYYKFVMKDIENYHDEEKLKEEKLHEKHQQQLRIQIEQIKDKKHRNAIELAEKRAIEDKMLENARKKIELEKLKIENARRKAKEQQERVNRENEENQKIRSIQAQKEADEDQRLMREYAAKLDKDEWERENAFNSRMEKMAKFNEKFENEGAGKALKEEQIKMEQLLLMEQQKKEQADAEKERIKSENRKKRLQQMVTENEKIVMIRKLKENEIREQDKKYARAALDDVARYKQEQLNLKKKEHAHHAAYRKVLDEQMRTKLPQADPTSAAFIGRERELNQSLYEEAYRRIKGTNNSEQNATIMNPKIVTHK